MDNWIALAISGVLGAVFTYVAAHKYKLGVVRASAGISVLVGGFFYLFPFNLSPELVQEIPIVCCGASFVGMTAQNRLKVVWIALAGLLFVFLYLVAKSPFKGVGGTLGTAACISTLISFSLYNILKLGAKNKGTEVPN